MIKNTINPNLHNVFSKSVAGIPHSKDEINMLLKEKLKWVIEEKRTKVTQVAVDIKCSPSTLYNIYTKNEADTSILRRLSDYFNVELTWWLDEKSNENPYNSTTITNSNYIGSGSNNNTANLNTAREDSKVDLMLEKNKNEHLLSLLNEKDKTILSQEKTISILQETITLINNRK